MYATSLRAAIESSLRHVKLTDADEAAVVLALTYADQIDAQEGDTTKLGPALLNTLAALGMTPAARAALTKGMPGEPEERDPLDELRARRERQRSG